MNFSQMWRWPLHSPRRLFGTLGLLVVLLVSVTVLPSVLSEEAASTPASSPAAGGQPALPPSPSPSPSQPKADPSPNGTTDYGQALDVARAFVTAWASHPEADHPNPFPVWYASVAVYATDDYARRLATVQPQNVPATKVVGTLRLSDTGGGARTEVAVNTDSGPVSVSMLQDRDGRWRVSDLQPGAQQEAG